MIERFVGEHAFLSNFYRSPVGMYGETYRTVEHAFQAAKWPPVPDDREKAGENYRWRHLIRTADTAAKAKQLGGRRGGGPPIREDWDEFRVEAMRRLLERKFEPGSSLATKLRLTDPQVLVEGNSWGDFFWGAIVVTEKGLAEMVEREPETGVWRPDSRGHLAGVNMLGRLLMERRGFLAEEIESTEEIERAVACESTEARERPA